MRVLMLLALATAAYGQTTTMKDLLDRLAREAEAFQKIAPTVQGRETLEQKALKPPAKFRIGKAATEPQQPQWQIRDIVSAYGYAVIGADNGLHEIRQVSFVDGRTIRDENSAQNLLAKLATASDAKSKLQSLRQMEKYGLRGAVTDIGQLLLLFDRRSQERYEFTGGPFAANRPDIVLRYKQLDGPAAMTVIQGESGDAGGLRVEGEVRFRRTRGNPFTVTMKAASAGQGDKYRQEVTVDYVMSEFGTMLPVTAEHREIMDGKAVVENKFTYAGFRMLGKN